MPNWLLCTCIVSIIILIGVLGLLIVRKLRRNPDREDNDITLGLGEQAGIIFAIVVGFVAVTVLGAFDKAIKTAEAEANQVLTIWVDARAYPPDFELKVRNAVENFLANVINEGWPQQRLGKISLTANQSFENLYRLLIDYVPTSRAQQAVHTAIIQKINLIFESRESRSFINTHGLPSAVYYVIVLSVLIIFGFDWALTHRSLRMHLILTSLLGFGIGLILFLIVAFDYPYRGKVSVGPESFHKALNYIDRLKIEQPPSPGIG